MLRPLPTPPCHVCISLYTCANVICIKLLLTYLLRTSELNHALFVCVLYIKEKSFYELLNRLKRVVCKFLRYTLFNLTILK